MFHFYTPWNNQKTYAFLIFFREYRRGTLVENKLRIHTLFKLHDVQLTTFRQSFENSYPWKNANIHFHENMKMLNKETW